MGRSLLVRLLALAVLGAGFAAAVTVWLTWETPPEDVVLDADNGIRAELYHYAREHPDWDGVEPLLRELAERTDRRIVLTRSDGKPIADSARGTTDLPETPAAVIDAVQWNAPPTAPTLSGRVVADGVGFAYRGWRLDPAEQHQRELLVDSATRCLRDYAVEIAAEPGQLQVARLFGGGMPTAPRPCVSPELMAPGAVNRALNDAAVEMTRACLDRQGLAYETVVDDRGLPWLRPAAGSPSRNAERAACDRDAQVAALAGHVAPTAHLYLGTGAGPLVPLGWRTAVIASSVVVVLAAFAVSMGRRLAHPLSELAIAAGRLADGNRGTAVRVRGPREVARVAAAFRFAAGVIDGADRSRRRLADDLAHELRRPLTSVRGCLEAAEAGLVPVDPAFLQSLYQETVLLETLVGDVTELGRSGIDVPEIRPTDQDAAGVAAQIVAKYQATGAAVRLDASGQVSVRADPARLRQALDNVVANAVRHTPDGGTVTVSVCRDAEHVRMAVSDTGVGIPAEHLPYVFDRFYRVEGVDGPGARLTGSGADFGPRRPQGLGLGLAIARQLVEAQHGSIEIASKVGAGTTVTIRLPQASR